MPRQDFRECARIYEIWRVETLPGTGNPSESKEPYHRILDSKLNFRHLSVRQKSFVSSNSSRALNTSPCLDPRPFQSLYTRQSIGHTQLTRHSYHTSTALSHCKLLEARYPYSVARKVAPHRAWELFNDTKAVTANPQKPRRPRHQAPISARCLPQVQFQEQVLPPR